ncbi:hypothetical protein CPB85DRAFT_1518852 [Mucidula mucida]|nr:hypothetical protein CPB85DRAFT_1518852 [Mucidula mucida]
MIFTSLFVAALASFAMAMPLNLNVASRDVYTPPVTDPTTGTVWTVNDTVTVTWDTSDPPELITNRFGSSIRLRKGDISLPVVLADQFDILLGEIEVTVPWVVAGDDYAIVLFGDSGNFSPTFSIIGGPEF